MNEGVVKEADNSEATNTWLLIFLEKEVELITKKFSLQVYVQNKNRTLVCHKAIDVSALHYVCLQSQQFGKASD